MSHLSSLDLRGRRGLLFALSVTDGGHMPGGVGGRNVWNQDGHLTMSGLIAL